MVLLPAAIVAVYAALLPLGSWQMDEFLILNGYRERGVSYLAERVGGWSPRPLSELLLWLYQRCADWLHWHLIAVFLGGLWLLLVGAAMAAASFPRFRGVRPRDAPSPIAPGLAVAALLASYFLLGKPGEVFYWPAGSAAYMPTLAGTTFAVVALALAPDIELWSGGARAALCAGLLIAACSSEAGAIFALLNGGGQVLRPLIPRAGQSPLPRASGIDPFLGAAWAWVLPAATAAFVLAMFSRNRAGTTEAVAMVAPTLHDLRASLGIGVRQFGHELIGVPMNIGGAAVLWLGAAIKLGLFLGFRPRLAGTGYRSGTACLIQSAALLAAALFTLVFAYWQFGAPCCERHETIRQCFVMLALFSAACALPVRPVAGGRRDWPGSDALPAALLALPLLVLFALRAPVLRADYARVPDTVAALSETWRSGLACCTDRMDFYNPPDATLVTAYSLRPGIYGRLPPGAAADTPDARDASSILAFFGKSSLLVLEPRD